MAIVTILFFVWGMLTSLNDILIPHLKSIFELSFARAMLVQFAFFSAYFVFSLPWSKVLNTIGYQKTMVAGLLAMAVGAGLYIPAASLASYPLFLTALVILAGGITGLQVAANPYVIGLGKPETAATRLNLTQAFNSFGTVIGPKLGGLLILSATPLAVTQLHLLSPERLYAYRVQEAASVKMPYAIIAIVLILSAFALGGFKLPAIVAPKDSEGSGPNVSLWHHSNLIFGAVAIFTYVGAEVSIGSFLVNYLGLPEIAGLSASAAAGFVSIYWGGAMIGRFLGSALLQRIDAGRLLAIYAIAAAALVTFSMLGGGHPAMWSMILVGFFNSIMFPTIFTLGVAELGAFTARGSGILNMAIVGGAILPLIQGVIADRFGLHHAFFLSVLCYLYIVFYGLIGSKTRRKNQS
jgi:FHS family L-fucose permease-like MFS transporter